MRHMVQAQCLIIHFLHLTFLNRAGWYMAKGSYFFATSRALPKFLYLGRTGHLGWEKVRSKFFPQ